MRIKPKLSIFLIVFILLCSGTLADKKNSETDEAYKKNFALIQAKQWDQAKLVAKKIGDRSLQKIVLSQSFLDEKNKAVDFWQITEFLQKNPKWPQHQALKVRAENLLNDCSDPRVIYHWFHKHKPKTGTGYKYYALAAAKVVKDAETLTPIIRNGWVYGCFPKGEKQDYYNKFQKYLRKIDTVKKIDNLISKGNISGARKLFDLVDNGYRKAFEAHIAFKNMQENAKRLFRAVPKEYYTPGLVYHYLSSRKCEFPPVNEVVSLVNAVKKYEMHDSDFWKVQSYIAREYIEQKKFDGAYAIAANHFASAPADVSEAEFLSGWLALRFLKKPDLAIKHFNKLVKVVKTPISLSRGLYWVARSHEALGKKEQAKKLYQDIANEFGYTFYGQVATMELGLKKLKLPAKAQLDHPNHRANLKGNDIAKAAYLVSKYANNAFAKLFLSEVIHLNQDVEKEEVMAIALALKNSNLHHKVWWSKNAIQKHVFLDNYSYPTPYKVRQLPVEEALTYSIIRQESVFDSKAISSASAMGLMQIIKPTACDTAKKISVKCHPEGLLRDPHYNITIGTHYLAEMLEKYQNSYVLTSASYNAGPHRVKKWLQIYGDPRALKHPRQVIDWIEMIPFFETRNYVQRVLENVQIYRIMLNRDSQFRLKQDLIPSLH